MNKWMRGQCPRIHLEVIKMIKWECPECEEVHEDVEGRETHCRKCGLIVIPHDGYTYDEGEHVEVAPTPPTS